MKTDAHSDRAFRCPGSYDPSRVLGYAQAWLAERCWTLANAAELNPERTFRLFELASDWRTLLIILQEDQGRGSGSPDMGAAPLRRALELQDELRSGRYRPGPFLERPAPEPGEERLIVEQSPTDKVVQRAVKRVLEAVVEPRFSDTSMAYRKGRGPKALATRISAFISTCSSEAHVVRLDVKRCFSSVLRKKLTQVLRRHVRDGRFIQLLHLMLNVAIQGMDGKRRPSRGIAEGAVLSPLLINIFLNEFDQPLVQALDADILVLRYGDDVLLTVPGDRARAEQTAAVAESLLGRLGLVVKPEKRHITPMAEPFDFVGYRFQRVTGPDGVPACVVDVADKTIDRFLNKHFIPEQREYHESPDKYRERLVESMRRWLSGRPIADETRDRLLELIDVKVASDPPHPDDGYIERVSERHRSNLEAIERRWTIVEPDFSAWQSDPRVYSERCAWVRAHVEYFGAQISGLRGDLVQATSYERHLALKIEEPLRTRGASHLERESALLGNAQYRSVLDEVQSIELNLEFLNGRYSALMIDQEILSRHLAILRLEMLENGGSAFRAARRMAPSRGSGAR